MEDDGLIPWLTGKPSIHQVEFLVREFGKDNKSVQTSFADRNDWYLRSVCENCTQ